ncbi:VapC toxin family PIN domain ribonuclease [Massilia sp. YIM B04103]|uniref:VapC toxin family PIN domain ribonuclease n=1 Tax=Massilia sp. YIM B04103 TaxID=2963106 RepID=UPI00210C8507|nr:VapC toxin family PIN domain ribonuclease [Massilia sp. YIM B04103]
MSGVLIDTSVWVDHFRKGNPILKKLLNQDLAFTHQMVIGEIACGTPPEPREQTLSDLKLLPMVQHISLRETMEFIERESIYGAGCGLVDMVLLTSTLITPETKLWSLDKHLAGLADRFKVAYRRIQS